MSITTPPPCLLQKADAWQDALAKFAVLFFGIALWNKGLSFYAYYLLPLAWVLDSGPARFRRTASVPLVPAVLGLCIVLALGILWSEDPKLGFKVWRRYFAFLVFIPYLGLLNRERLPWAIAGVLIGYSGALSIGVYQWLVVGVQGIPPLGLPYLHFSSMLAIGVIVSLYLASISRNNTARTLLWLLTLLLLFIQFGQSARAILAATLLSSTLLIFLLYRKERKLLLIVMTSLILIVGLFAYSSPVFHERLEQVERDIALLKQGKYETSLGYRLAIWEIGLHGVSERLLSGHGTGMAAGYFDKTVETFKEGRYKSLREFHSTTYHYHNDWIEIGMHAGILGLVAYAYFLWSFFQTLRAYPVAPLGAALVCFIMLLGLTDILVFHRQAIYLLLIVAAISFVWQQSYHRTVPKSGNGKTEK